MDILEGDTLVVGSKDYPIKECGEWKTDRMNTPGFRRMDTEDASTKRPPAIAGGKRGAATTNLTGLKCTPLDPVSSEIQRRVALETPMELLQTFITDGTGFVHLVVEDIKV
jgi:hypothetical protein